MGLDQGMHPRGLENVLEEEEVFLLLVSDGGDGRGHLHRVQEVGEGGGGQWHHRRWRTVHGQEYSCRRGDELRKNHILFEGVRL